MPIDNGYCSQYYMSMPTLSADRHEQRFILQVVQPALLGMMDGSVSTLAPLFATAEITQNPHKAFIVGLAAALGAGLSMGLAEALSDDGRVSGRGHPWLRGGITSITTVLGGLFHTLPFLLASLSTALTLAYGVVVVELLTIAYVRFHYMKSPLRTTIVQVVLGGGLVFAVGIWLGHIGSS